MTVRVQLECQVRTLELTCPSARMRVLFLAPVRERPQEGHRRTHHGARMRDAVDAAQGFRRHPHLQVLRQPVHARG